MKSVIRNAAIAGAVNVLGFTAIAQANQISAKFYQTGTLNGVDSSGAAGVARQTGDWNNLNNTNYTSNSSITYTYYGLLDNTGQALGTTPGVSPSIALTTSFFSSGPGSVGGFTYSGGTTEDNQLFTGSIGTDSTLATTTDTVTLSNIPYSYYTIYVYLGGNSSHIWEAQDANTGLNYYVFGDYATTNGYSLGTATSSGSALPANYVTFNESSPNDVLSFPTASDGGFNLAVFGIQIVQTPEPASLGLLGAVGAFGLLRRRGQKNGNR